MHEKEKVLVDFADFLMSHYNPCELQGSKCLVGDPNPCCMHTRFKADSLCPHMQNSKCTNPNLSCKCWFCQTALNNMNNECREAVYALEAIAKELGFMSRPYLGEKYYGADRPVHEY